jgi:hypothetical protein
MITYVNYQNDDTIGYQGMLEIMIPSIIGKGHSTSYYEHHEEDMSYHTRCTDTAFTTKYQARSESIFRQGNNMGYMPIPSMNCRKRAKYLYLVHT